MQARRGRPPQPSWLALYFPLSAITKAFKGDVAANPKPVNRQTHTDTNQSHRRTGVVFYVLACCRGALGDACLLECRQGWRTSRVGRACNVANLQCAGCRQPPDCRVVQIHPPGGVNLPQRQATIRISIRMVPTIGTMPVARVCACLIGANRLQLRVEIKCGGHLIRPTALDTIVVMIMASIGARCVFILTVRLQTYSRRPATHRNAVRIEFCAQTL